MAAFLERQLVQPCFKSTCELHCMRGVSFLLHPCDLLPFFGTLEISVRSMISVIKCNKGLGYTCSMPLLCWTLLQPPVSVTLCNTHWWWSVFLQIWGSLDFAGESSGKSMEGGR